MSEVRQDVKPSLLPLAERLTTAIDAAGGKSMISKALGVGRSTVDRWMHAQAEPSVSDIAKLAQICDVPIGWLATGDSQPVSGIFPSASPDVVNIPILDVEAAAGAGAFNHGAEVLAELPFPAGFLRRLAIKPDTARAIRARGDSMEPTIPDGMLVLIDTSSREPIEGRIYAVRGPDGLRLKRIQRGVDGSVILISDNSTLYAPERIPEHEIDRVRIVGRAFWTEKLL